MKSKTSHTGLDAIFFGTHPDDVELNCGGTVIALVNSGKRIGIIDLTLGELSSRGNPVTRQKETEAATKMLGITVRENLHIPDGNIEINSGNKTKVITAIRKYKPDMVFAPFPLDRHPDHVNAGNLIREAAFFSGLRKIVTKGLNPFRPRRTIYYGSAYEIPVSIIFDVSKTFDKKVKVLKCYSTQFYNQNTDEPQTFISTKLFANEIEARARHCGFKIGTEYGEPYFTNENIKVDSKTLFEI